MWNRHGQWPLHSAAEGGHLETIKTLVAADPEGLFEDCRDENCAFRPIDFAARAGHRDAVELLYSLHQQHAELRSSMFSSVPSANVLYFLALVEGGWVEAVRDCIEGGRVTAKEWKEGSAMYLAASCGQVNVIDLLLEKGMDINRGNEFGDPPLQAAINAENMEVLKALLEKGADPKRMGNEAICPVHEAIYRENTEAIEILGAYGCPMNRQDEDGRVSLTIAMSGDASMEVVKALIACGADWNAVNDGGCTSIEYATTLKRKDYLELFLDEGGDVDTKTSGMYSVIPRLVTGGVNVNARNQAGETPLHVG
ncbi:unnamed protein product, partial [Symbiodinium sp. KB8]